MEDMDCSVETAVAKNLNWLETMKQSNGFGGPVVHYWRDSLDYIGPAGDWRYEGIIQSFLALYRKTKNELFLKKAIEAGDFAVLLQTESGQFKESNFESNPSFGNSGQPHEAAVVIGLTQLAIELKKQKKGQWQKYFQAAEKNIEQVLIPCFWNEPNETFQQYPKGQFDEGPNLFVPNKISTICEALCGFYDLKKDEKYLQLATSAGKTIVQLQSKEEKTRGGIFQANNREQVISYYTARCVRPLLILHEKTKKEEFRDCAVLAGVFLKNMQQEDGYFGFGFDSGLKQQLFPVFAAGSGDILLALQALGNYAPQVKRGTRWLLQQQNDNGGFRSFSGISQKNSFDTQLKKLCWQDVIPVVGWNDKTLRFLISQIDANLPPAGVEVSDRVEIETSNGTYLETPKKIEIEGTANWVFQKKEQFSDGPTAPAKRFFYALGNHSLKPVQSVGRMGWKLVKQNK